MTPPGAFLTLPYDIRAKVYSQVFTGSQIHLDLANGASENRLQSQDDPSSVLAYYGPEDYDLLLVCSQIRDEATPILVSSLRLCLSHPQVHRRFSIDFFQLTGDSKAPALLRQAIPSTKYIDFVSDYASRLKSDLRAFPKLRELRLHGQFELSASLNDTKIDNDPMVLLDKDHGGAFLQSLIDGPMNYTMATPGSYLDPAMKRSREYKSIWKGCVSFKKFTDERPKHPDRMTVHFDIDPGTNTLLGKRFSYGEDYLIFGNPKKLLKGYQEKMAEYNAREKEKKERKKREDHDLLMLERMLQLWRNWE